LSGNNQGGTHTDAGDASGEAGQPDIGPRPAHYTYTDLVDEASIEKYYGDTYARYGVMPFWYLAAGGTDPYAAVSLAERTNYYEASSTTDASRIEAEDLRVVSKSGGSLTPRYMDWVVKNA